MTAPNLGVTQVIQQPGLGNVLGQSIGGIAQMMQQLEQFRMQQARDNTNQAYLGEQTTTMRTNREQAKADREAATRQAQQQGEAYRQLLQLPQVTSMFNPGEIASLNVMGPTEGMKWLQEQMKPQTVAGDARLVARGPDGTPTVTLAPDTTPKLGDSPTSLREYNSARGAALGRQPTDPTFNAADYDQWLQDQTRRGAGGTSVTLATDNFASGLGTGAAGILTKSQQDAADAAADLETVSQLRGLLNEGMITGAGANAISSVGNALAQFGIGGDGVRDPVARTQAYTAIVGQRVGRIIKQFGSGTGLSDADRQYAERIAGGQISLTPEALNRILGIADKQNRWVIQRHNAQVERLPVGEDVRGTYRIPVPGAAQEPNKMFDVGGRQVQGTLDPASGKYYVIQNGRRFWVEP